VLTRGRVVMKLYLLVGTSDAADDVEDCDEKFYPAVIGKKNRKKPIAIQLYNIVMYYSIS